MKPDPVAFFDTIHQTYLQAEMAANSAPEGFFSIAGHTIKLRFAGSVLQPLLTPALEHLAIAPVADPALTILIWDSASTGTPWPDFPWRDYDIAISHEGKKLSNLFTPRGDILGYNDGRIFTHIGDELFSLLDMERNTAIYWCQDASRLPLYEKGAPVRTILHWWMHTRNFQMIHSGAIGTPTGGVLLAGKGGTGKSTTALICLNSDLNYASDDYSLIQLDPQPYVYSLYNTAKVSADNLDRVSHVSRNGENVPRTNNEKFVYYLHQHFPQKIVKGFPIRAILLPQITGQPRTTYSPARPEESIKALALSTLKQLAGAGKSSLQMITNLARLLPSYHLELGVDMSQIPTIIRKVIDSS